MEWMLKVLHATTNANKQPLFLSMRQFSKYLQCSAEESFEGLMESNCDFFFVVNYPLLKET